MPSVPLSLGTPNLHFRSPLPFSSPLHFHTPSLNPFLLPHISIPQTPSLLMDSSYLLPIHHNTNAPPPPPTGHSKSLFWHHSFYWGKNVEFLFPGWPGRSSGMYALSLIVVFVLAVMVEFLSNLNLVKPGSNRVAAVAFQSGIHAIRAGFAYMVMLAVMSYNGGVFITAAVGHAVGYVVFGSPLFKKAS
ncbi:PREDICTED: copper transporter 6-like [Ipomoea nil]|uniref:copper transporter 6-like n=1 Tax=Ipomoea nil TaxID=35883 RepID=UPI000901BBB2|nr:PREDICTED: copper transporter 6-like [Ipomoea nil]